MDFPIQHLPEYHRINDELTDESVYPPPTTTPPRHAKYRSRFSRKVRVELWAAKRGCWATIGPPAPLNSQCPEEFLRKHSKAPPVYLDPQVLTNPDLDLKNGPRDKFLNSRPRMRCEFGPQLQPNASDSSERRDFVRENAERVGKLSGRRRTCDWETPYWAQPTYGRIPDYLICRKWELLQKELDTVAQMEAARLPPNCRYMGDCERCALIGGLKGRWEECNRDFITMPNHATFALDAKRQRLEEELKEIEKDLRLLTSDAPIIIHDDSPCY